MLGRIIFTYFGIMTALYGMEKPQVATQDELNAKCAQVSLETYRSINENVVFSDKPATNSSFWDIEKLQIKPFFVKKRGVLLSEALNDLTNGNSQTQFECMLADIITRWKILCTFEMDKVILKLEANDPEFRFPLINAPLLSIFKNYALYYRFSARDVAFTIGQTTVNTQEEWKQLVKFEGWLEQLSVLNAFEMVHQTNMSRPYKTIEGGSLCLPNVAGVKGVGKAENLFCVNAQEGLYYGFGPSFKNGPKTLLEIAKDLQQYADKEHPGLFLKEIIPHLTTLHTKVPKGCHALQYLVEPEMCSFLSLKAVKDQLKLMNDK